MNLPRNHRGLGEIRSSIRSKLSAKTKTKGSHFLRLYTMEREKDRLEQELVIINKRKGQLDSRIETLRVKMAESAGEPAEVSASAPRLRRGTAKITPPSTLPPVTRIKIGY